MHRHVRRLIPAFALLFALLIAPTATAQTTTVEGSVERGTRLPQAGTCAGVICGTGTLVPFGEARYVYVPVTFEQISRSCFEVTAILQIIVSDTGDTLDLATESTACFRGNSPNTPGSQKSWGNPVTDSGTWTVESGTGVFEGATGEGTYTFSSAGAALHGQLSGELELAGG